MSLNARNPLLHSNAQFAQGSNTSLNNPGGVAIDAAGNLYVSDTGNHVILSVAVDGSVATVAGTGEQGFGGDDGLATAAQLDAPMGLALNAVGDIYVADSRNHRVRKITAATGVITTVAGDGAAGFGGDGGMATAASLRRPQALAFDDSGNLYIADAGNHRVRKVTISTGAITTVAGNGEQGFSGDGGDALLASIDTPCGVAVDSAGNLYIADSFNQRIRMVTRATGAISTLAGDGSVGYGSAGAIAGAQFARPRGLSLTPASTLYVADSNNNRIQMLGSGSVATAAGNGQQDNTGDAAVSVSASLDTPRAVAVTVQGGVAIADTQNESVRIVTGSGINTVAGSAPKYVEALALVGDARQTYGACRLTAAFSNGSQTATGQLLLREGLGVNPTLLSSASLAANAAQFGNLPLHVGAHYLLATYAGDANNAAIASGVFVLAVEPAPVTVTANGAQINYGQSVPTLSGAYTGVFAADAANVSVQYSVAASAVSAPGVYPISAALSGSAAADYAPVLSSTSGSLTILHAPVNVSLQSSKTSPALGEALTLTADVVSTTSGVPGGSVDFFDGSTKLNALPAPIASGQAKITLSTLSLGAHQLTAVYAGDTNFLGGSSAALSLDVAQPDFAMTATPSSQTLLPGQSTNYDLALTPASGSFAYAVSLTVGALPKGVTAVFAPASIAANSGATHVVLTLSATQQAQQRDRSSGLLFAVFLCGCLTLQYGARRRRWRLALAALFAIFCLTMSGCGTGGYFNHADVSNTVTVTATCGSVSRQVSLQVIIR